jgi:hypothetical protein
VGSLEHGYNPLGPGASKLVMFVKTTSMSA